MRRRRLIASFGVCLGLASGAVIAAEPAELLPLLGQPQPPAPPPSAPAKPPVPKPATPPAAPPTAPPTTIPPGVATPPTLAPVTSNVGAAPESLTSSGAGYTPYMMGDLPTTSFVRGTVTFPGLVNVFIPPVLKTVTIVIPPDPETGRGGQTITRVIVVSPGRTVSEQGTIQRSILIPQTGVGSIKIEENESPRPMDRAYVTYNHFTDITNAFPGIPGSNLHRETFGIEKTFLDGDASIELRASTLQTTGGSSLANDDFGDLTVISKFALINDRQTGNVFSVGLAVTAPTGPSATLPDGSRLNPTLLQPWTGFIYNLDRLYAQGFSSLIIPTDSRDPLVATSSLGVGFWLYRASDPSALVSYVTPIVEGHSTYAVTHRGLDQTLIGFPDVFTMTDGVHIGLGQRSNLAVGLAVPLSGPKIFNVEAIAQLNWQF